MLSVTAMQRKQQTLHERSLSYLIAGEGPVLLLIHGLGASSEHWRQVIEPLARDHTVIAPDLPGHGDSEPGGGGDYSVGGLAAILRDLLLVLGHRRSTLVGHSLGGGVAMQFAYQFPEHLERLVLLSSGGLGPEVSPLLSAAALPGAGAYIAATAPFARALRRPRPRRAIARLHSTELTEILYGYGRLAEPRRRAAFLATVRSVIGLAGQRVSALDRLYLANAVPVLIAWGAADRLVPAAHAQRALRGIPNARLEIFEGVGHLPQLEAPERFLETLQRFLSETEPSEFGWEEWREQLLTQAASGLPGASR
jgi:pimeloyl-ACP methyl ester carboxylesterase